MSEKRMLLIESGNFIGGVLYNLFTQNSTLSIIETSPSNVKELMKAIADYQPEIVVLDDTVQSTYMRLLLRHMQRSRNFRVIVVNTNNNRVQVYQKKQVSVTQTEDFFAIL